jgi:hypothetical protein
MWEVRVLIDDSSNELVNVQVVCDRALGVGIVPANISGPFLPNEPSKH